MNHWTTDPAHPLHIAALALRCPMCKAAPGRNCRAITRDGGDLPGRILHSARTEA